MAERRFKRRAERKTSDRPVRKRKIAIAVDVWQTQFGPSSVRAVFDVYATLAGIDPETVKSKRSFSHCVNALRKNEDPDYKDPRDQAAH